MRGHRAPFANVLIILVIGVGSGVHAQPASTASPALYDGEMLVTAAGYPALYRSIPAYNSKPLIVFVPGDAHLARIVYGYPGGHDEDFVSHWVNRAGYPFLAVSYPLGNAVFGASYPGYTIEDWGNQGAEVVAKVIDAPEYRGRTACTDLTDPEWERLRLMVGPSASDLSETVEGNHFFFIGSIGARATVEKILRLHARVQSIPTVAATSPK